MDDQVREYEVQAAVEQREALCAAADCLARIAAPVCRDGQHFRHEVECQQLGARKTPGQRRQRAASAAAEIQDPLGLQVEQLEALDQPLAHHALQEITAVEARRSARKRGAHAALVDGRHSGRAEPHGLGALGVGGRLRHRVARLPEPAACRGGP